MILSGYIILSPRGSINPREPLQLFDSHASAVRAALATRPKGTYTIAKARQFFSTAYGSAMLALIRSRKDASTDPFFKLQKEPYISPSSLSVSKLDILRAQLKQEKSERAMAEMLDDVVAKASADSLPSFSSGSKAMPETIARVNSERANLASPTVLPSVRPKEKIEWELDRLMCRFNANSLCTQQDIDTRAKNRKEVVFALERLNKFANREHKATPMDICLRKVDLLILFRAGKLPENLKHIAKITQLTML